MANSKILITGSGGFIAPNLIRAILYENKLDTIVSIDRINKSVSLNAVLNNFYSNKNHTFHIGDIADEHFVDIIFEIEKPDIVINAAAYTFVDHSLKAPNDFIHSNVLGTQVLLNAAVKWKVKKFIQISTDEVYGQLTDESSQPWTEESITDPRNPYSASKMCAELLVKAAHSSFGLNYIITRSSNNYGPRQTAEKLIPQTIKCILQNKKIPVYGKGLQIRDWIHVFDNCSAIIKILESGKNNEIYNISANQEFTNIEVVQEICNTIGRGHNLIEFIEDPRGPAHDFRYAMDTSKLKQLGWVPNLKFKNGIKQCCEWFVKNEFLHLR
jgi:dTDP-glucose 4,6-dehydratase